MLREPAQQLDARLRGEASYREPGNLFLNRRYISRVAMTQAVYADAADNIDERVAIHVGDRASERLLDDNACHQREALKARCEHLVLFDAQSLAFRARDFGFEVRFLRDWKRNPT